MNWRIIQWYFNFIYTPIYDFCIAQSKPYQRLRVFYLNKLVLPLKARRLSNLSTILALAAAIDARDHYTYGHSQKVATYAVMLGEAIGIEPERLSALRIAALLHDIGKIGIPDNLLLKQQRFNEAEKKEIQRHTTLAASILKHVPSLSNLLPHIVHHHERFDGTGYPDGIRGVEIPLESRILAIADSYDAMTSLRPYRPPLQLRDAITELRQCAGTQFDPELVMAFCKIIGQNCHNTAMPKTDQIV